MIVIIAKTKVKPGKRDELIKLCQPVIELTRADEGCLQYDLLLSSEDPDVIFFVEKYKDKAAFKVHATSKYMADYIEASKELKESSSMDRFTVEDK